MTQPKTPTQVPAATTHSPEDLQAVRRLLAYIGEDPDREGLLETPARFLKAWEEYTRGYRINPEEILKSFEDGAQRVDEMVIVRDIPVYSLCEHHLAPFFGKAYVGYVPDKRILGLSKISRLVEIFGRRLQVQERLTNQIADALDTHLKPLGVAVVIECRHMCMESRGVRHTGTATVTSALRGSIKANADTRREFLSLIGR
jgi:GTP cyclohydrolase I